MYKTHLDRGAAIGSRNRVNGGFGGCYSGFKGFYTTQHGDHQARYTRHHAVLRYNGYYLQRVYIKYRQT